MVGGKQGGRQMPPGARVGVPYVIARNLGRPVTHAERDALQQTIGRIKQSNDDFYGKTVDHGTAMGLPGKRR